MSKYNKTNNGSTAHFTSRLPIKRWDQRKNVTYLNSSAEPKINDRKLTSNLARLNARIKENSFDVKTMQEKLTTILRLDYKTCKYQGLVQLMNAVKNGKFFEGQMIFEEVNIAGHKNALRNMYKGWISKSFGTIRKENNLNSNFEGSYYIHVSVYVGKYKSKHYVVDAGGRDSFIPMMFGTIGIRRFRKAFNYQSNFYAVSPIHDDQGICKSNIILQRALAGIGTKYLYHSPSLTSEVFCNVLLGGVTDDTFKPILQNLIAPNSTTHGVGQKNQDLDSAKYFHNELTSQIRQVRQGIHLALCCYINRKDKKEKPWFRQMIRSYVDLMSCIRFNDAEKCTAIINTGLTLSSYNVNGETPLTFAAREGRTTICIHLVDFALGAKLKMSLGGDINLPDANGNTALLKAFLNYYFDTCDTLLNLGANGHDARFQKTLCDSYSKWYSQDKFQQCIDLVQHFKHVIDVDVFYYHSMLEAIKEGNQNEYIQHMDNLYKDDMAYVDI